MYLSNRRVVGRGYEHFLGTLSLPLPLGEGELHRLVCRLKIGDSTVINVIVESHIRLMTQIVGRYFAITNHYDQVNDLVGVALLSLTKAVHRAQKNLKDTNITPYLVNAVHSGLAKFIAEDYIVRIPQQTQSDYGYMMPQIKVDSTIDPPSNDDIVISKIILQDLLDHCCTGTIDRAIIKYRSNGFTDDEISNIVGLSRATVRRMRIELHNRFLRLEQESQNDVMVH